jgi:hypothetical protein
MTRTTRLVGALTLLAFGNGGCSWLFMSSAPEPVLAPSSPIECTSSRAAPVLDSICAGYFVANGIFWAAADSCSDVASGDCYESSTKSSGIAISAGLAALCAFSAVSGFRSSGRCGQVKGLNALCITGDVAACQALRPGFTPSGWTPAQPRPDPWGAPPAPPPPPQAPQGGTQ